MPTQRPSRWDPDSLNVRLCVHGFSRVNWELVSFAALRHGVKCTRQSDTIPDIMRRGPRTSIKWRLGLGAPLPGSQAFGSRRAMAVRATGSGACCAMRQNRFACIYHSVELKKSQNLLEHQLRHGPKTTSKMLSTLITSIVTLLLAKRVAAELTFTSPTNDTVWYVGSSVHCVIQRASAIICDSSSCCSPSDSPSSFSLC